MSSSDNTKATDDSSGTNTPSADDTVKDTYSFIVVANRLPVDIEIDPDGTKHFEPSPGGLVTALKPVLKEHEAHGSAGPEQHPKAPRQPPSRIRSRPTKASH